MIHLSLIRYFFRMHMDNNSTCRSYGPLSKFTHLEIKQLKVYVVTECYHINNPDN